MNRKSALACICMTVMMLAQAQDWTFKVDDNGYIHNWLALPPIQLDSKAGIHNEDSQRDFYERDFFPKQRIAEPSENDKVTVDGKELEWKTYQVEDPCWKFDTPPVNSIYFVVTYVIAKEEIPNVRLSIGSDDSSKWFLNHVEVLRIYAGRAVEKDTNQTLPLTLKKGTNVIMALVINGNGEAGVSARFIDKDGNPLKNIRVSTEPDKTPAPAPAPAKAPEKTPASPGK